MQIQTDPCHKEFLAALGKTSLPYDGVAQLWVESLQDFIDLMSSEEYQTVVSIYHSKMVFHIHDSDFIDCRPG